MPISDRLGGMSLQRLPPDQAVEKADEPLTPEKSYPRRLLAHTLQKWLEHFGMKATVTSLVSIFVAWWKTGAFADVAITSILTFVIVMVALHLLELFRAPYFLDKAKREEISGLKETQRKITKSHVQQVTDLQTRLDEAQSHKLSFEIDIFRCEVELEDYSDSDDEDEHAYRIRAGLKMRFINDDVNAILVRRISLSLVKDAGTMEYLLLETFPLTWKNVGENWQFKGLSVPASTATDDYWFDVRVDVPHDLNQYMKSGTDLRITMDASRQKPYFTDLAINWRAAERGPRSIIAFRSTLDTLSGNST
jgi:hypothetical protein